MKAGKLKYDLQQLTGRTVLLHLLCWLLFISYELGFVYYLSGKFGSAVNYLIYYTLNISLFYCHLRLLNFAFNRISPFYGKALLLFTAEMALLLLLRMTFDLLLAPAAGFEGKLQYARGFVLLGLFRSFYFCVFATFYWVAGHIGYFRRLASSAAEQQLLAEIQKAETERQLGASKNAFLQQQINPHMLFNALGFVYTSVYKSSADAARCVWLLSEIMRFSLEGAGPDDKTSLEGECLQLENLLDINRYRFDDAMFINVIIEKDMDGFRIIPLILLTLTENIFKHGDLRDPFTPALLKISLDGNGQLTYYSYNRKKSKNATTRLHRTGLQNVRTRLDYAYPQAYTLDIAETADDFALTLNLQL